MGPSTTATFCTLTEVCWLYVLLTEEHATTEAPLSIKLVEFFFGSVLVNYLAIGKHYFLIYDIQEFVRLNSLSHLIWDGVRIPGVLFTHLLAIYMVGLK